MHELKIPNETIGRHLWLLLPVNSEMSENAIFFKTQVKKIFPLCWKIVKYIFDVS